MTDSKVMHSDSYKGWLYKWTNYIKGYQKRWFVLQNGLLSYYRSQAEMAHSCRGTINLAKAFIHTEDSCTFVISNGDTTIFHLKASSEVERQRWVTALELAKSKAVKMLESDEEEEDLDSFERPDKKELQNTLKTLNSKLGDLNICNDLISKHGSALQRALGEVEQIDAGEDVSQKIKTVHERATLLRITTNAMIKACSDYHDLAQSQGHRWQRMLQHEHEQRLRLEDMVEQLARQQNNLENAARKLQNTTGAKSPKPNNTVTSSSDEEDFHDAVEEQQEDFVVTLKHTLTKTHKRTGSGISTVSVESLGANLLRAENESSESDFDDHPTNEAWVIANKDSISNNLLVNLVGLLLLACLVPLGYAYYILLTVGDLIVMPITMLCSSISAISGSLNVFGRRRSLSLSDLQLDSLLPVFPQKLTLPKPMQSGFLCVPGKSDSKSSLDAGKAAGGARKRRAVIPEKPNHSLNLWSIMKNCIGKDLSKIPMPVNFNEPMSFIQRLTEDLAYSDCLDQAAKCEDSCEQLAYIAAFTISSYSTTTTRSGKPFNPLLGETFECDRLEDYGWRSICEQVSHHPPTCAMHAEGRGWVFWQEVTVTSKFRGKYLQIIPLGIMHLRFPKTGHHYTWRKLTTTVHNIIVGRLWVDNHGEMDIVNHSNGDNCHVKFSAYSYFSREIARKVTGVITNKTGDVRYVCTGTWDEKLECAKVVNTSQNSKGKPVFETGPYKCLWKRKYPPSYMEKMYNYTELAVELNELEEGVAPTDSRLRPDQRMMENGDWDGANKEKLRLEEKQRAARRRRETEMEAATAAGAEHSGYQPAWFRKEIDDTTGNPIHVFNDEYWLHKDKQDWSRSGDIF